MNKYHAIKRTINGHTFDSIAESRMYQNLMLLQKEGKIMGLKLQPEFILLHGYVTANGKKIRPTKYRADFRFYDNEQKRERVIDCKGFKTSVYILKKKLFDYKYKEKGLYLEEDIGRRTYG